MLGALAFANTCAAINCLKSSQLVKRIESCNLNSAPDVLNTKNPLHKLAGSLRRFRLLNGQDWKLALRQFEIAFRPLRLTLHRLTPINNNLYDLLRLEHTLLE